MARPCRFALHRSWPRDFWGGKNSFRYGHRRRRGGSSPVTIPPSPRRSSRLSGMRLRALSSSSFQTPPKVCRKGSPPPPCMPHSLHCRTGGVAGIISAPGRSRRRRQWQRSPKPTCKFDRRSQMPARKPRLNCAAPAFDRESVKIMLRAGNCAGDSMTHGRTTDLVYREQNDIRSRFKVQRPP